jgi:methyl-accepting chemotaxis protein
MKTTVNVKLVLILAVIISAMLFVVGMRVVITETNHLADLVILDGQTLAGSIASTVSSSLSTNDQLTLDQTFQNFSKDQNILYALIEKEDGTPASLYLNRDNGSLLGFSNDREEPIKRIRAMKGRSDLLFAEAPVLFQNKSIGTVKIGFIKYWINQRSLRQITGIVVVGIMGLLLMFWTLINFNSIKESVYPVKEMPVEYHAPNENIRNLSGSQDEIGVLVSSLNKMVTDLRSVIVRIGSAVNNVVSTSDQLTSTSKRLFEGAGVQMSALDVTSKSLSQMSSSLAGSNELVGALYKLSSESSSSILEMTASIKEMTHQVRVLMEGVNTTSSSIEEMSITVTGIAESISILLDSAENTSASLNEINATIKTVEFSTKEATRLSKSVTSDASNLGMKAVKKTIAGMNKIREDVAVSSEIINDLAHKSMEIGKILTVIEEVTRQTNLLALNSAILAAQAGEGGKGFAVVSDEIKNMADQTALSTKGIAEIIGSIQKGVVNGIESMKKGMATVEDGVLVSQEAFVALETIGESSEQSFKMISEIERAMKEQAQRIKQVDEATIRFTDTLKQIKNSTEEHKKGTKLIVSAVQSMQSTADLVNRAIIEQGKGAQQINQAVALVQVKTEEVLKTAEQQKDAGDMILASVEKISGITRQNRTFSTEVNDAVENLVSEATQLKSEVNRFKVIADAKS